MSVLKVLETRVGGLPGLDFRVLDNRLLISEEVEEDHACNRWVDDID